MTQEQTELLRDTMQNVMSNFFEENDIDTTGCEIRLYSSPDGFTIVIHSDQK